MKQPSAKIRRYGLRIGAQAVRDRSPELNGPPGVERDVVEALVEQVELGMIEAWDYNGEMYFISPAPEPKN